MSGVEVNPPPIRPPAKWLNDPSLSADVQQLYYFVYQLWQRTGGGEDIIGVPDPENEEKIDDALNGWANRYYGASDFQSAFKEIVISDNYTTYGNQIIKLSSNLIVTLNGSPRGKERVYIKSTGKPFSVKSEVIKIDGENTITYAKPYIGVWFSYSVELDSWSIL